MVACLFRYLYILSLCVRAKFSWRQPSTQSCPAQLYPVVYIYSTQQFQLYDSDQSLIMIMRLHLGAECFLAVINRFAWEERFFKLMSRHFSITTVRTLYFVLHIEHLLILLGRFQSFSIS